MSWKNQLRNDSVPWLLEANDPGVRYLAVRDLLDLSPDDKKLKSARKMAHKEGPIAEILSKMNMEKAIGSSPDLAITPSTDPQFGP
jgi:hypothetical protein